jgi:DNA helicase-2/ATP-dependent DNA helicase PcrA
VVELIERTTDDVGYRPDLDPDTPEEVTRQSDLARLRALAAEFERAHPDATVTAFARELTRRFSTEHEGRGVNLLTYHRAKGLEFDAVMLPRLLDGEIPFRSGRAKAHPDEERRLLYVALTRARRYLFLTWPSDGRAGPSPFLDELGIRAAARPTTVRSAPVGTPAVGGPLFDRLREWRRRRATADGVPAYVVFADKTLAAIADHRPRDRTELAGISGVGPAKLERYAEEVLAIVEGRSPQADARA